MKVDVLSLDKKPGTFGLDQAIKQNRNARTPPRTPRSGYTTVLWMALFNLAAVALLIVAFVHGWAQMVFGSDITGLTYIIATVFLFGLGMSFVKTWKVACETNCVRAHNPCTGTLAAEYIESIRGRSAGSRAISASTLRSRSAHGFRRYSMWQAVWSCLA